MEPMYDAVIVGAGIAGTSIAGALADRGWRTALLDKRTSPRHKVCGEFLSPESLHFIADLRIDRDVLAALEPSEMSTARLTLANGISLEIPLPGTALGISRYALDHALLSDARKKGVHVRTGVKVTGIFPNERGYQLDVRSPRERRAITARAVIGAWGRSPQSAVTGGFRGRSSADRALIGVKSHYEGAGDGQVVELFIFPGGYLGISPIEGGHRNVSALLTRSTFHRAGKSVSGAIEAATRFHPTLEQRIGCARPVPGSQAVVANVTPSRKLAAWGRVPHIGDAAAVIPPLCGDGMAMALRSAALCTPLAHRFLRGTLSLDEWRGRYTTALYSEFVSPLRWGQFVERGLCNAAAAPFMLRLGQTMPDLARRVVLATRLKAKNAE